jgi:hypothetical protein
MDGALAAQMAQRVLSTSYSWSRLTLVANIACDRDGDREP